MVEVCSVHIVWDHMVKNSFTLIEMMVVVTVILLISGGSLAWYGNMTRMQNLGKEVEHIKSLLQTAQSNAMTSNTVLCTDPSTAYSYGHTITFQGDTVRLDPDCSTSPTPIVYRPSNQLLIATPSIAIRFNESGHPMQAECLPMGYVGATNCSYIAISEVGLITSGECTQCSPNYVCPCN